MKHSSPIKLSYVYTAISVILGPALPFLSARLFPKQIACFDLVSSLEYYVLEDGGPRIYHREVVGNYYSDAFFLLVSAGTMIIIGIVLVKSIRNRKQSFTRQQKIISTLLIVSMLAGYGLILAYAALEMWCASI